MRETDQHVIASAIPAVVAWQRAGLCILVAALFGAGIWMQSRVYLNHDVAWITHSARWLLQGRRFGSDIVDANPPLIWFFSLPAAAVAQAGLLSEPMALRAWIWLVCGGSLLLSYRLLAPLRVAGRRLEGAAIIVGAAFAATVLAAAAFGQRDYLAFVLGLPYCLLLAWRVEGGSDCPRTLAALTGAVAVFGFGYKPWFLAVPLLLEGLRLLEHRTWRGVIRPETVSLGLGLVGYITAALVFTPDYFSIALPLARATYWAYDSMLPVWRHIGPAFEPLTYGLALSALALSLPPTARVLLVAAGGFLLSYWAQHKGFAYHAYPALATAVVFFLHAAARAIQRWRTPVPGARAGLQSALAACLALLATECCWLWSAPARQWLASYDAATGDVGQQRRELVETLDRLAPRGSLVYAFSTHPFPAFPTLSYAQAEWGSAFPAQFAVPAWVRSRPPAGVDRVAVAWAIRVQRRYVLDEFQRYRPQVVMVETARSGRLGLRQPFDDVAFYCQDPAFAQLWRSYRPGPQIGSIRLYVRETASSP